VRVSGPRDIVRTLIANQMLVIADLSHKEPGERIVQLRADETSLAEAVRVLQIEPSSIRIRLEPTARKRVKVAARFTGQIEEGKEIYQAHLAPEEVEIEGPQSQINKLDRVVAETVNLDGRRESFQSSVEVEPPHYSVRIATPGPIRLSVEIGEKRSLRRFTNVPVQWLDQPAAGRLLTKTVAVEIDGPKSAVEALRAEDLRVEIRTTGLSSGVDRVIPQVRLPASADKNIEVRNVIPGEVKLKRL
jgi:YbbR domain-containing protein